MKKINVVVFVFGILILLGSNIRAKEDILTGLKGISVSGDYALYSSYVWRGFELDSDPVAQTGLNIAYNVITVGIWNSQDITYKDSVNSAEVDFVIDLTKEFGDVSVSLGNTFYTFPAADAISKEFYLGISYGTLFSPVFTLYYDYGKESDGGGEGAYCKIAFGHSIPLAVPDISLELSGSLGINNKLFIAGDGGDFGVSSSLNVSLKKGLSFSPAISYVVPFGDMADDNDGAQEAAIYGGFSFGYEF